jgi:ATP-dependent Zn protease
MTGDLIVSLLPFLLLIGFWWFLVKRAGSGGFQNPTVDKLEEIRQELERIRRALERDPFRKS